MPLALVAAGGAREQAEYEVPDQNQCGGCHGTDTTSKALHPLGPKARHLNHDFAYAQGSENQLVRWTRAGFLVDAPPPASAPRDADWRDPAAPLEARARAYLDINCGHCHSPQGPGNTSGLWLDAATREPLRLGRCKLPIAAGHGTGDRRYGVVPGKPDESILIYRMRSDDPSVMMPELGRSVVHEEGVRLIREWIADSRMEIEQARLLTLKAAYLMDTVGNKGAAIEISAIKVVVPNMALRVIDRAIQAHGGGGVSDDFPLAAMYAGIRTLRLADGPDEVHRILVAKHVLRRYEDGGSWDFGN